MSRITVAVGRGHSGLWGDFAYHAPVLSHQRGEDWGIYPTFPIGQVLRATSGGINSQILLAFLAHWIGILQPEKALRESAGAL